MRISELIECLQDIQSKEGVLLVDIRTEYDGWYLAGGDVDEIEIAEVVRFVTESDDNYTIEHKITERAVQLSSYEIC